MDEEYWIEFSNIIKMDDENIEKFKKLYGEGQRFPVSSDTSLCETKISFSQIIPEPSRDEANSNWVDNTNQDVWVWRKKNSPDENSAPDSVFGNSLKSWRMDNWGIPSDVLYDGYEEPYIRTLEGLLKGEYPFYTFSKPPIKIFEKMAADGLVFEAKRTSKASDEWATGKGQSAEGPFQYHIGPMTGSEKMSLELVAHEFLEPEENSDDRPTIVVKSREP